MGGSFPLCQQGPILMSKYEPPSSSLRVLENMPVLLGHPETKVIQKAYKGKKFLCELPGGQIFFESALELDTDGSVYNLQDDTGQAHTSTRYHIDRRSMDADNDNFFVLPGGFYKQYGIFPGDVGVVIYNQWKVFACFGDVGPPEKLGEGSIALHRALGHETIIGGRLNNVGIAGGVITIVFPGSGDGRAKHNTESRQLGQGLFKELLQEADEYQWNHVISLSRRDIVLSENRTHVEAQLFEWIQELVRAAPPGDGGERINAAYLLQNAIGVNALMRLLPTEPGQKQKVTVHAEVILGRYPSGRRYISLIRFNVPGNGMAGAAATGGAQQRNTR
jgi:hypothetical protein